MAQTKAQIVDRAAQECGKLRLGQSLQTQDQTRFEAAYDEVYGELENEGLAVWLSTASVPTKLAKLMVFLVAHNVSGTYGISGARFERIVLITGAEDEKAYRQMKKIITPPHSSEDENVDY